LANLDKNDAVNTFLEVVGRITKVLYSLLLRTCSKDTGATQSGQTTFCGETGPMPASQGGGDTIKQIFVIQWIPHVAIQESDKSSHLTGRTLCVSKKLLYTLRDVGHPHEMVFVEPSHIFFDEMIGNQDNRLVFELRSLPGVSKVAIVLVHSFPLQVKLAQSFSGISFGKMSAGLMGGLQR
jgi:hypothetical protein